MQKASYTGGMVAAMESVEPGTNTSPEELILATTMLAWTPIAETGSCPWSCVGGAFAQHRSQGSQGS